MCVFLGHSAVLGCSKCLKKFPGVIGQRDYSGFDRSKWPIRSLLEHRKNVCSIRKCSTVTERKSLYGCRYTVFLDLPYFDPVRMTIIDPMHNLYLGSAITLWIEEGLITSKDMCLIQSRVDSVQAPHYVGRIPL